MMKRAVILLSIEKSKSYQKWTKDEIDFLKRNYLRYGSKELGNILHKTINSIHHKTSKMGLVKQLRQEWTKEQEEFLKKNYNTICRKELSILMGKSINSIKGRLNKIGIRNPQKKISQDDINKIIKMYSVNALSILHIEKKLKINYMTIWRVLKKNKIPLNSRKEYKQINPDWNIKISNTLKELYKEGKISPYNKGKKSPHLRKRNLENNPMTNPKSIEKMKKTIRHLSACGKRKIPTKDSSIEIKIQEILSNLHIEYFTHKYMHIEHGYQCDILIPKQETEGVIIPQKTIIECDGCFWHGCKKCDKGHLKNIAKRKSLDNLRTKELQDKGFKIIRLWEHEIREMVLSEFKKRINK